MLVWTKLFRPNMWSGKPDDYVPLICLKILFKAKRIWTWLCKGTVLSLCYCCKWKYAATYNHNRNEEKYNVVFNPSMEPEALTYVITPGGIYKNDFKKNHIRHHETPGASFQDNGFGFRRSVMQNTCYDLRYTILYEQKIVNSSVNSPEKVYCMNEEYKYILKYCQEILVWNRFRILLPWKNSIICLHYE